MIKVIFAERLKELRLEKEITQKELASRLSIVHYTISDWEKGRSEPDLQTLYEIAKIFEVSTDYLLGVID